MVVGLIALGTDQGFTDYGRSVDILAQSISVNQSPLPPTLIGRWRYNGGFSTDNQALNTGKVTFSHESETQLTIYPNGTFTEASMSFSTLGTYDTTTSGTTDGSDRGRVVIHGTTLSFQYDNGKVWNAEYKFDGGTLVLNGSYYSRVG
ncbi:MAG: hypothetical protein Q7K03_06365 [Dehalococcoidia bacterium]|nr:hypothetical protein [Dehalococcoidia bacterium]